MFYRLPHPPLAFEIPDDWLVEAGAVGFLPTGCSFRSSAYSVSNEVLVALSEIVPMLRHPQVSRDHHGFRRQGGMDGGPGGMVDVLKAMVGGTHLPPVRVRSIRGRSAEGFAYVLLDGFHRYYASLALNLSHIPCELKDDLRPEVRFGFEL